MDVEGCELSAFVLLSFLFCLHFDDRQENGRETNVVHFCNITGDTLRHFAQFGSTRWNNNGGFAIALTVLDEKETSNPKTLLDTQNFFYEEVILENIIILWMKF